MSSLGIFLASVRTHSPAHQGTEFPGLIPLIEAYLDSLNVDIETRCALSRYLQFVKRRANGSLMTTATWIRKFVHEHPDYKHDSVVNESVNYDLIRALENIEKGELKVPELLGRFV
jgi:glutamate--cysteine ligase catalytic subunit